MQKDLLNEIHQELSLEPVTAGVRFVNYLVDFVIFYLVTISVSIAFKSAVASSVFASLFINYLIFFLYYVLLEGTTNGKTIGKMVTGTVAVREDGAPFTFNDAVMRSLSRLVPFEAFSTFGGYPWHDRWTGTRVVRG